MITFRSIFKQFSDSAMSVALGLSGATMLEELLPPIKYIIPFGVGVDDDFYIAVSHQEAFFKKNFTRDLVISRVSDSSFLDSSFGGSKSLFFNIESDTPSIMGITLLDSINGREFNEFGCEINRAANLLLFNYTPDSIIVREDSPFNTLEDLLFYSKAAPGECCFSGEGSGSANHLAKVRFDKLAKLNTQYLPFSSSRDSVAALLDRKVVATWGGTSVGAKYDGSVRLLAVASEIRHPRFPDVPTFKELGYELVTGIYRGISLPNSVSKSDAELIARMFLDINNDDEYRQSMADDGMLLLDIPFSNMDEFIESKSQEYLALVQEMYEVNYSE